MASRDAARIEARPIRQTEPRIAPATRFVGWTARSVRIARFRCAFGWTLRTQSLSSYVSTAMRSVMRMGYMLS